MSDINDKYDASDPDVVDAINRKGSRSSTTARSEQRQRVDDGDCPMVAGATIERAANQ